MRLEDFAIKAIQTTRKGTTITISARPVGQLPDGIIKARISGMLGLEIEARDYTDKTLARVDLLRPEQVDVCPLDLSAKIKFNLEATGDGVRAEAFDLLTILDAQEEQALAERMSQGAQPGRPSPKDTAPTVIWNPIWEEQLDLFSELSDTLAKHGATIELQ